jgi:hypothetical protein
VHRDAAALADDVAHDARDVASGQHPVDDADPAAVRGLPDGLQEQAVLAVAAVDDACLALRGHRPGAVRVVADEAREARGRVEPGQAEPVDRPVAADERRGSGIADERVVFDRSGHRGPSFPRTHDSFGRSEERRPQRVTSVQLSSPA